MQKGNLIVVGILLAVVLLGGGYFLMNRATTTETPAPIATTESTVSQTTDGEVLEILVEGEEFSYSPSTLKIKAGQKVKIFFKNVGEMDHDLVIEELGVRTKEIKSGEEDVLEFVAPITPGALTYYCSVGEHRAKGMEGTITVE